MVSAETGTLTGAENHWCSAQPMSQLGQSRRSLVSGQFCPQSVPLRDLSMCSNVPTKIALFDYVVGAQKD